MKRETIFQAVQTILKERNINNITENTVFTELGLDSLDLMDLIIKAEQKYDVIIPDEELLEIKTVKDLLNILENLLNK